MKPNLKILSCLTVLTLCNCSIPNVSNAMNPEGNRKSLPRTTSHRRLDAQQIQTPLICLAAKNNDVRTIQTILETNPNAIYAVDENGYTAIQIALGLNNEEAVRCLLDNGATFDSVASTTKPISVALGMCAFFK